MRKAARKVLVAASGPPPEDVFHFTDLGALSGMITTRSLWATYAHALNDESEIRCGTDEARRTIQALPSRSFLHEPCLWALDIDRGYWSMMTVPFVTSFCEKESSAHWLHYGRNGTGVAVVFSSRGLAEHPGAGLFRKSVLSRTSLPR
jgi:hypothetical protein